MSEAAGHKTPLPEQAWALPAQLAAIGDCAGPASSLLTNVDLLARAAGAQATDAESSAQESDVQDEDDQAEPQVGPRALANGVLKRVIGERLAAARALNGWGQMDFARESMGAANSTQVSLWESGKRLPPLPVLIEAARKLDVSVDYLVGESAEVERDPRTAARSAVLKRVERMLRFNAGTVTELLLNACASPASDELRVAKISSRAHALCDAVQKFRELNAAGFDEAPAGAMLVRTMRELRESLQQVDRYLHRAAYARDTAMTQARAATLARARRDQTDHRPT